MKVFIDLNVVLAEEVEADWIVTRDPPGFSESSVPAISPGELLKQIPNA